MIRRHLPRIWEYNRFWQKERESGSRQEPVEYDPAMDDLPEDLRMPRDRGEMNRFKLSLKKSLVEAKRGQSVSATRVLADINRTLRQMAKETKDDD